MAGIPCRHGRQVFPFGFYETIALSPALVSRTARALWLYSVIRTHLAIARLSPFFSGERVVALLLRVAAFVPPHSRARALAVRKLIDRLLSVRLYRKSHLNLSS